MHRCLKRYIVRERYPLILADSADSARAAWHRSVNAPTGTRPAPIAVVPAARLSVSSGGWN